MFVTRRWLWASLVIVPVVLLVVTGVAVGYGLPPTGWMAALHFDACELPCWLGVVPGETPLADAQNRVVETLRGFGDVVETRNMAWYGDWRFFVHSPDSKYPYQVALLAESAQSPVRLIMLEISMQGQPPTLGMFYPLLNHPTSIQDIRHVSSMVETHLFFENEAVVLTVYDSACEKFRPDQNINQILLYADPLAPASVRAWEGFRHHYGPC